MEKAALALLLLFTGVPRDEGAFSRKLACGTGKIFLSWQRMTS